MRKTAREQFGGDQATIMVSGERVSAAGAALANGFFGNALDIDDGYRNVKGHPGACALPPVLAAAELAGECSGLGISHRPGGRLRTGHPGRGDPPRHLQAYHASGSWGAIAGAAAAGRLLGLSESQTALHAMGAAEYHAPIAPMMKGIDTPFHGQGQHRLGLHGGGHVGPHGPGRVHRHPPAVRRRPGPGMGGKAWGVSGKSSTSISNPMPPAAGASRPWPAPSKSSGNNHLTPDQIRHIRVRTFEAATRLPNGHPRDTEEAQYSLAFPVAAALLDGEVGPARCCRRACTIPNCCPCWTGFPPKWPPNSRPNSRPRPRPK
jgi:hypothetical protein